MVQTRDEVAFFYTSDVFSYFDDVSCELAAADCVGFGQVFDICMGKEKKGAIVKCVRVLEKVQADVRFQSVGFCATADTLTRTSSSPITGTGFCSILIVLLAWTTCAFIVFGISGDMPKFLAQWSNGGCSFVKRRELTNVSRTTCETAPKIGEVYIPL